MRCLEPPRGDPLAESRPPILMHWPQGGVGGRVTRWSGPAARSPPGLARTSADNRRSGQHGAAQGGRDQIVGQSRRIAPPRGNSAGDLVRFRCQEV